jgi:accessory gene regulator B
MLKKFSKIIKYLFTLKYVKLLSYNRTRWLKNKLGDSIFTIKFLGKEYVINNNSTKVKNVYYHGFNLVIGAINKGLLLVLVGLIFGILSQILVATTAFVLLRVFVGGLHFDSYTKCAWISLASLVTLGLLAKYIPYSPVINLIVFSTLFGIALIYAPIEHKNRKLSDKEKVRYKYIALFILVILGILQGLIDNNNINNCVMYGVLLSGVIATPIFKNVK